MTKQICIHKTKEKITLLKFSLITKIKSPKLKKKRRKQNNFWNPKKIKKLFL